MNKYKTTQNNSRLKNKLVHLDTRTPKNLSNSVDQKNKIRDISLERDRQGNGNGLNKREIDNIGSPVSRLNLGGDNKNNGKVDLNASLNSPN